MITDTVTIDGYTQSGASANTLAVGSDAAILIELDGSSAGGVTGLDFRDAGSTGSVVQGVAINRINGYAIAAGPATQIRGNHIGTDPAGTTSLANSYGILIDTAATQPVTVGGTTPADRNVISGNTQIGIQVLAVDGTTADTTIVGNYIGTDSTGTAALPNGSEGIWVGADPGALVTGTTIGNGTTAGRNVISGNSGEGIAMWDNSTLTAIRGNYIGVGADGTTPLGNALVGGCVAFRCGGVVIRNFVSNNTVGGDLPGDGNVIANNPTGITVFSGVNNRLVGNSIFDNVGAGLLVNPVADPIGSFNFFPPANDPGDVDFGGVALANNSQNYPVVGSASIQSDVLTVEFTIDSLETSSAYPIRIDLYSADDPISGEGERLLSTTTVAAPGDGTVTRGAASDFGIVLGSPIVLLATDADGNTSNFSPVAIVDNLPTPANKVLPTVTTLERFGASVSVDGDWAAVGQPDTGGTGGAVSILERNPNDASWSIVQTITDPTRDNFGLAVAIDGNTLAIAANVTGGGGEVQIHLRPDTSTPFAVSTYLGASADPVIDLSGDDVIIGTSGAVDIWSRASGSWQIELSTIGSPTFGTTVAIDGDVAVVGDTSNTIAGSVLVYQRSGTTWTAADTLTNPDGVIAGSDWFGSALALDGTTLVVGHSLAENPAGDEGAAWVYEGSPGAWGTPQKLSGSTIGTGDVFGQSVDVKGDWIVVGSPAHEEVGSPTRDGGAYVFNRNGATWVETDYLLADDRAANDSFGAAVAITDAGSGDARVLVGAPFDDNSAGFDRGAVYTFEVIVEPENKIISPEPATNERFAATVDVEGDFLIVGAGGNGDAGPGAGTAYAFEREVDGTWTFVQELTPAGLAAGADYGGTVALAYSTTTGSYVAVIGAPGQGDGAAYVWSSDGGSWAEIGLLTGDAGDAQFGAALDIDNISGSDFNVVVGSPFPFGAGDAYVWNIDLTIPTITLLAKIDQAQSSIAIGVGDSPGFGLGVAIDGDTIVVGAPLSDAAGLNAGAASVLRATNAAFTEWSEEAVLLPCAVDPPGGVTSDCSSGDLNTQLGSGLDIEGDTVVVGGTGKDANAGRVFVFDRSGSTWTLTQQLGFAGIAAGDVLGGAVDLESDVIVASAELGGDLHQGLVVVYRNVAGTWVEETTLTGADALNDDRVGRSLAVGSDGTLIVGSRNTRVSGVETAGAAYAFAVVLAAPAVPGRIYAPDAAAGDYFGQSVDIHDDWMVVGARQGDGAVTDAGSAYVFRRNLTNDEWEFVTELAPADGTFNQWFGWSVAISGTSFDDDGDAGNFVIAVGAPDLFGATDGAVYLYRYDFVTRRLGVHAQGHRSGRIGRFRLLRGVGTDERRVPQRHLCARHRRAEPAHCGQARCCLSLPLHRHRESVLRRLADAGRHGRRADADQRRQARVRRRTRR